ncbi:MAG: methyltransferase domain-containing protein [Flavobacteriaceae bacterium]
MKHKIREFGIEDADHYWKDRKDSGRVAEKRIHHFIKELVDTVTNSDSTAKILICGVGDGHEYRLCAENYQTWGVEMSQYAIDQYEFNNDTIVNADLNNGIPEFNENFDGIVVSMVLHWLDDPESFLKESKVKLTEHGKLIIVIPNITHYRYRLGFLAGHFPPISASHKNFQTPAEMEDMFNKAGYDIEKRAAVKPVLKARLYPTLFATEIGYILKPSNA